MKQKIILSLMALIISALSANAQVLVDENGIMQVGNVKQNIYDDILVTSRDTSIILNIRGNGYFWSKGKLTIGDCSSKYAMNVSVGEVQNGDGDTDQMWLHGKRGLYYTASHNAGDTIFYYDVDRGNDFHFNCNVLASNISVASDSRFKEDVKPLDNTLGSVTSLSPVSYRLKSRLGGTATGTKRAAAMPAGLTEKERRDIEFFNKFHAEIENDGPHFGFIAQEVKEVFPELVHTDKDGYMYVDYIGMIPLLVNAINELNEQVQELKTENEGLNNEIRMAQAVGNSGTSNSQLADELTRNALYQNAPNPFTASTDIRLSLCSDVSQATLYIFDMQGTLLRTIPVSDRGNVTVTIDGSELSAGMYIYSLIADGTEIASKRMILTK